MKKLLLIIATGLFSLQITAQTAAENFRTVCASCHTIGKGQLVGPDLKGVHKKHAEKWLLKWIKSSQTLVNAGDKVAVELFQKYNQIPMPDNPQFSDDDIKGLLAYIKTESGDTEEKTAAAVTETPAATEQKTAETKTTETAVVSPPAQNPAAPAQTQTIETASSFVAVDKDFDSTIYIIVGLAITFFLIIIAVLTRSVIVLSNELKKTYKENLHK